MGISRYSSDDDANNPNAFNNDLQKLAAIEGVSSRLDEKCIILKDYLNIL